jgi:hypothetical protein
MKSLYYSGLPKLLFLLVPLVAFFTSCEKDITVDLPQGEEKIVVEGYINPGGPAYVFISKTAPFFAPVDSASLIASAIKNATVTISDGIITDTLIAPLPDIGYLYLSTVITGETGKSYFLKIVTEDGIVLTSETHIPAAVALDSLWFRPQSVTDSLGWVWARITDPPQQGDSYRWFAKRIGKDSDFIPPSASVTDDRFYNGLSFDFAYNRGKAPYSNAEDDNNDEEGFFKRGDTIVVKFATITRASYDFWRAAESQSSANGSPFGTVSPLKSNINGGIGIWEGFSYTLDTVIAQ